MAKILVVDDDEDILDALTMVLEDEGYQVETAFKGEKVYSLIDKIKPDVILLDILMSGHDGREICRKIKKNPATRNIPIIMVSAHPSAADGAKVNGADDFLPKPFEISELISKIKKFSK